MTLKALKNYKYQEIIVKPLEITDILNEEIELINDDPSILRIYCRVDLNLLTIGKYEA